MLKNTRDCVFILLSTCIFLVFYILVVYAFEIAYSPSTSIIVRSSLNTSPVDTLGEQ